MYLLEILNHKIIFFSDTRFYNSNELMTIYYQLLNKKSKNTYLTKCFFSLMSHNFLHTHNKSPFFYKYVIVLNGDDIFVHQS